MVWKINTSEDAKANLRDIGSWLSQPGAGKLAAQKKRAIKAAVRDLRASPLRHPICSATGRRKRSVAGGYEIHYAVYPDPMGSTTSGRVEVLFVKAPHQDYSSFL